MRSDRLRHRKSMLAKVSAAAIAVAGVMGAAPSAWAADLSWTGADGTNPTLWDLTSINWNNDTTGVPPTAPTPWLNAATPHRAFFTVAETPGTVTVDGNIDVGTIDFDLGGWTIAGGTGDLSHGLGAGGTGGILSLVTTGDNTIGATIVDRGVTAPTSIAVGGAGVITLTGTNTYTGGSVLNAGGTLAIDDLARVGSGTIDFNGGWLRIDGTTLTTVDSRIVAGETTALFNVANSGHTLNFGVGLAAGAGEFRKDGPGTLVVSGANLNTGATEIRSGTLRISGANDRLGTGSVLALTNADAVLDLNGLNQTVAGLDGFTTASTVVTNSVAATTSTLTIGNGGASYMGAINDGAGIVAVTKAGAGTQTMTGTSNYSGDTRVTAGVLQVDTSGSAASLGTGDIVLAGGSLRVNTTTTFDSSRSISMEGAASLDNRNNGTTVTYNGALTGAGALTRASNSAAQPNGTVVLGGNSSSYTGAVAINGNGLIGGDAFLARRGGLVVASNNALGDTLAGTTINASGWLGFQGGVQYTAAEPVTMASATQQITGAIRSLSGDNRFDGPIAITTNTTTGNVIGTDAGSSLRLKGAISGTGAVTKAGGGTLIFDTAQTYAGATLIALQGNGSGQIVPAGTLKLEGPTGTVAASSVRVGPTGAFLVDSSSSPATDITRTASVRLAQGAVMTVNGNSANDTSDVFGQFRVGPSFGSGEGFVVVNPGAGRTSTLKFADLFRESTGNSQGNGGSINFRGPNFGQAPGANVARAIFSGAFVNGSWLTVTDTVTGKTSYALHDVTNGLRPLIASEYTLPAGGTMPNNSGFRALLDQSNTATNVVGNTTVASTTMHGSNITVTGDVGSTFRSSGILSQGTGNAINAPTVHVATSGSTSEQFVYVEGDLTIRSNLVLGGTATAATFVKTGPGEVRLLGANTWAPNGGVSPALIWANRIHNGTVSFAKAENLGASNNIWALFSGGELKLLDLATRQALDPTATAVISVPQAIRLGTAAAVTIDPVSTRIRVDTGSTMEIGFIDTRHTTSTGTGFTKVGAGDLRLTTTAAGNESDNQTGAVYLNEGSITMAGTSVMMRSGQFFAAPGTALNIDSSTRPTGFAFRVGGVYLNGADINVTGSAVDTEDRNGGFVLTPGPTKVSVTSGGGTTNFSSSGAPTRLQGGTAVFSGTSLGTAATNVAQVKFTSTPVNIGGILPYALADQTAGGSGTAFAAYGSNGIIVNPTNTASVSAGGNVLLTASDATNGTVNSLHLQGTGVSAGVAGGTLNVTSGGVLSTGGANTIAADTLAFGAREGIIHAVSDLTVSGAVSSSVGLTKAGPGTLTLNGANNWTGATHSNGGTLLLNNPLATNSSVNVNAGTVRTTSMTASSFNSLKVETSVGAELDVNNGGLIIKDDTVANIRGLLVAGSGGVGFAAQTWDQPGINSSFSATDPLTYGVGYMDNDNFILGGKATFDGVSVPGGSILVKSTLSGDADLDWDVDDDDVTVLGIFYGGPGHWYEADFDYNGVVDDDDVTIMGINYGQSLPAAGGLAGVSAVPEPSTLSVLGVAATGLMRRRRRS